MHITRRIPGWVWGISFTALVLVAVVAYSVQRDKDSSDDEGGTVSATAEARPDPASQADAKRRLNRDVRTYVRAFLGRESTMNSADYIERIVPLESPDHLDYFKQYLSTPVEQAYIDQDVTVRVVIVSKPEGESHGEVGNRRFEGLVTLRLISIQGGERSIMMPDTVYEIHMVESSKKWLSTYFAPQI